MAISVAVPKELSGIKTKIVFNLTKRQLICFGSGGFLGSCFYIATNDVVGTELSTFAMMIVLFPFLFLAMYEKEGFPAEKWLYLMLRQKFFTQGIRPYQSETLYLLEEQGVKNFEQKIRGRTKKGQPEEQEQEVNHFEQKARGRTSRSQPKENR